MRVSELKALLENYNEDELKEIIRELYKTIPKKMREEKGVDALVKDLASFKNSKKRQKAKQAAPKNITLLKQEIEKFISDAYEQYYLAPNRVIPKKERPKWRFKVKNYIKELQKFSLYREEGRTATDLLMKLYQLLNYACGYYLFNTEDPFRSVGMEQTKLLEILGSRVLSNGVDKASVKSVIKLVIDHELSRETSFAMVVNTLIQLLKTADAKEIAIAQSKLLIAELNKKLPSLSTSEQHSWHSEKYKQEQKIEGLVEIIVKIQFELAEVNEGIQSFYHYTNEKDAEIALYSLLSWLSAYDLKEHWLNEYESALKRGVSPRPQLKKEHRFLQNHNEFPTSQAFYYYDE